MKKKILRVVVILLVASLMLACNLNSFKPKAPDLKKEVEKQVEKMEQGGDADQEKDEGKGKELAPGQNKDKNKSSHQGGDAEPTPGDLPFSLGSGEYPEEFPVPEDAASLMVMGEGAGAVVNYQTSMPISEAAQWVRDTLTSRGLTEEPQVTVVMDNLFSMVFTGSASGKKLVVQGVQLDAKTTNINVRYE